MGQGTIIKRELDHGRVRYDVYYDLGPDPVTGKRRQRKKVYQTRREAVAFLTEQQAAVASGTAVDRSTRTVRDLMEFWLENDVRHRVSAVTLEGYGITVRKHIIPHLGEIQIQQLTPARLQVFYTDKLNAGCGPRTVELCHLNLSQALDQAVRLGWIARNVADLVRPPRWRPKEMETWSTEEARLFLAMAGDSTYGPLWQLALATGLRKGELLGLRWQDIGFERGVACIRQTIGKLQGKVEIKPPKTMKSRREVNLSRDILDVLHRHRMHQMERRLELGSAWNDHDLVFTNSTGGPIHPDNLDRDFNRLVRKAGVKRIRIHDCRHSFATLASRLGIPVKVISESLGHADVATTLRIYTHVAPAQRVELAEKVGDALFGHTAEAP